jgi:hypothetical protein
LNDRRARLIARRRRLKQAYVYGDFEEDEDIYRQELKQIRQELEALPSEDDLFHIHQAAHLLESLAEVWDEADPTDRRDLVRLMLRKVEIDVVQKRVLFLRPVATFIPLFRAIPILRECNLGTFTPIWSEEMSDLAPTPELPALTTLPDQPINLPFLPTWPWKVDPKKRISPSLSDALKARRRAGGTSESVVSVPRPGVPPILLDGRKWSDVTLEELPLTEALEKPERTLAFIATPLVIQENGSNSAGELPEAILRVLDQEGHWHLIDIVPETMPGHWIFAFFPEVWSYVDAYYWGVYDFYNNLRRGGFEVTQREHTFRQSIALSVALQIARQRPDVLGLLPDNVYEEGLHRLETAIKERGADSLEPSEVTVIHVRAVRKWREREGQKSN